MPDSLPSLGMALFDESVLVQRDSTSHHLRLRILSGLRSSADQVRYHSAKYVETTPKRTLAQAIRLEITDERDPYFLYFMEMDETDYFNLKKQQHIRVDFKDFPEKLVELIKACGTSLSLYVPITY